MARECLHLIPSEARVLTGAIPKCHASFIQPNKAAPIHPDVVNGEQDGHEPPEAEAGRVEQGLPMAVPRAIPGGIKRPQAMQEHEHGNPRTRWQRVCAQKAMPSNATLREPVPKRLGLWLTFGVVPVSHPDVPLGSALRDYSPRAAPLLPKGRNAEGMSGRACATSEYQRDAEVLPCPGSSLPQ